MSFSGDYSLYIHVPFCRSFCDYCDFYSVLSPPGAPEKGGELEERYVDTLIEDARRLFEEFPPQRVPTVYIGGGTPSVLGARTMGRLLETLGELLPPDGDREWTVEANPDSLDGEFLRTCREAGVNRLSLGVQTLSSPILEKLHRHGGTERRSLALAAELFPGAFSADLLSGLPGQDRALLLGDIEQVLSFKPAHVSLYALSLEEGTPLWERGAELPSRDRADRLWISGRDALERSGYAQYEVSNFCLPGKESRHNLRYWGMKNWLALGPSGSGTLIDDQEGTGLRLSWPADLDAWLVRGPDWRARMEEERLDRLTLIKESLLMGFRCTRWPDASLFKRRFGISPEEAIPQTLARWRARGLAGTQNTTAGTALTPGGLLFLNSFLAEAFEELENHPPENQYSKSDAN